MKHQDYATSVAELVSEIEEEHRVRKVTGWVTPKSGILVRKGKWILPWSLKERIVFRGRFYPLLPWHIGFRTVFRKQPLIIDGIPRYLELKGYGHDGRDLFLNEHGSGDVFFGMYLDNAIKEFERLEQARLAGLSVPLALGVVEIPRTEYVSMALATGFKSVFKVRLGFSDFAVKQLEDIIGKMSTASDDSYEDFYSRIANGVVKWIENHPDGMEAAIRIVVERVYDPKEPRDSIFNRVASSADALLTGKRFGYLIRASKCPVRVGDPSDKDLDTPENRKIAQKEGKIFWTLLEMGLIHHCPGTGNWTKAGEMTDFADIFDIRQEWDALLEHITFVKKTGVRDFVEYLIGPEHTGKDLQPFFLEGLCGRTASLQEATDEVLTLFP